MPVPILLRCNDRHLRIVWSISLFCAMSKKSQTRVPSEQEQKRFDQIARREMARFMLNCFERKIANARGQKLPPKYRPKFTP